MTHGKLLAGCLALALVAPGAVLADPWKDESGHGRDGRRSEAWDDWRRDRDWRGHRGPRYDEGGYFAPYAPRPRIPSGHLPPPGECRLWFPDRPPGHQPPPGRC